MKFSSFFSGRTLTLAACAAALAACGKPADPAPGSTAPAADKSLPVAESASVEEPVTVPAASSGLETFKTAVNGIKSFMDSHQDESDPSDALAKLRDLVLRISAVSTKDVPAELAAPFDSIKTLMQQVQTAFDALPVPVDRFEAWMAAETAKGGDHAKGAESRMADFVKNMTAIQKQIEPATARFNEAGKKFGIEPLELSGQ